MSETVSNDGEEQRLGQCKFTGCRARGDKLVYSEEWDDSDTQPVCEDHIRFARLNDAYEVVGDV